MVLRTAKDYEALLAKEGLPAELGHRVLRDAIGSPCPGCGQPARRLTRAEREDGIAAAIYCRGCARADDMAAIDYDFHPWARRNKGVVDARARDLAQRIEGGSALHDRALELLNSGELEGEALVVWQGFCDGLAEREIAQELGRAREYIYRRYLAPLRARCGYPVRANRGIPKRLRLARKEP